MNTAYPHIVRTEGTCGGRPRIENSRIEVRHLATILHQGGDVADMAAAYPHIEPVKIYAALAYYFDNKAEIDEYIEAENRAWEEGFAAEQERPKQPTQGMAA